MVFYLDSIWAEMWTNKKHQECVV